MASSLANLSTARSALAEAKTLKDVKLIRDQAKAIAEYLRAAGESLELQNDAAELKLRAERRIGEILGETVKRGGKSESNSRGGSSIPLPDGINHNQSSRYQRMATVPEPVFEAHVATVRDAGHELTSASVLRIAKAQKIATERNGTVTAHGCTVKQIEGLVGKQTFGCIYADPPWQYGNQGTRAATDNHYETMPFDELAALPIKSLSAEQCHLHLWTTNGFLVEALSLISEWGFEFKSTFIWVKPQLGIGNYWRCSHEIMLLGVKGGLTFPPTNIKSWVEHERTQHSAKPEEVRALIEKVSPGPYLELFGRKVVHGWTVWGNEIDKGLFDQGTKEL